MARAYSQDLRDRVLKAASEGLSNRQAAKRFGISPSAAIKWIERARTTGETGPRRQGQPRGSKLDAHAEFILGVLAEQPDITLNEMLERLRSERNLPVGMGTLSRFYAARSITFKKNRTRQRTESG